VQCTLEAASRGTLNARIEGQRRPANRSFLPSRPPSFLSSLALFAQTSYSPSRPTDENNTRPAGTTSSNGSRWSSPWKPISQLSRLRLFDPLLCLAKWTSRIRGGLTPTKAANDMRAKREKRLPPSRERTIYFTPVFQLAEMSATLITRTSRY
jgi:hypothetical protein